jgi:hypothetical protein
LGEIEGLDRTLRCLRDKRADALRLTRMTRQVDLGMPVLTQPVDFAMGHRIAMTKRRQTMSEGMPRGGISCRVLRDPDVCVRPPLLR